MFSFYSSGTSITANIFSIPLIYSSSSTRSYFPSYASRLYLATLSPSLLGLSGPSGEMGESSPLTPSLDFSNNTGLQCDSRSQGGSGFF